MMEHLASSREGAVETSLKMVDEADAYILILGTRFGWVPPEENKSITWLEYERAMKRKIPLLVFIMDEEMHAVWLKDIDMGIAAEMLAEFKDVVSQRHHIRKFRSHENLAELVGHSLQHLLLDVEQQPSESSTVKKSDDTYQKLMSFLIDRYRILDFRAMGAVGAAPLNLDLREMFIPLLGRRWLHHSDSGVGNKLLKDSPTKVSAARLTEPVNLVSLLLENPGLVLLGDPGSGKTTFLKYITLALAEHNSGIRLLPIKTPLLIPLSTYASHCYDMGLQEFIEKHFYEALHLDIAHMLEDHLENGDVIFLLDGLDEIRSRKDRVEVVERIKDLFIRHRKKGNRLVVTARTAIQEELVPLTGEMVECVLGEFTIEQIEEFLNKFTRVIERAARGDSIQTMEKNCPMER